MNPDQEEVTTTTSSVNDPYENRRKSKYAKEQQPPASIVDGTTFIIPPRSSTSMNSPSYHHQQGQKAQRRQESKEPFTIHQQQDEFYSKNLLIASTLVVTYLIEVTVQILLIVQCCRSIQKLELVMDSLLESTTRSISSWSWVLVMSSVGSSLLVTLVSIIWVFRGMDFSGRLCGRLLCYVMHSFLLALLWRYLKLAFAYDRADLEEFLRLKTIQTYVQSLPLVTIHLAWLLTAQQLLPVYFYQTPFDSYHALSSWLVVAEMLSVVTSLLVLSSVSSATQSASVVTCNINYLRGKLPRKEQQGGTGDNNNPNHPFNDSGTASTTGEDQAGGKMMMREPKLMTRVALYSRKSELGRGLLLISRLISLGMLVYEMNYWTGFITLLHLAVCFGWLSLGVIFTRRNDDNEDENIEAGISSSKSFDNKNCDSSANDSGLVVKSDVDVVKMQNGLFHHHHHPDNSVNVENNYSEKQGQMPTAFSKCLSVLQSEKSHPGNERENVRQVLIRVVLPLTYLLFWDLSPLPLMTVGVSNRLNLWATALPVLLTAVENMSITIFHVYNQQNMIWTVASGTCLLCGWVFVAASLFQKQRRALTLQRQDKEELSQNQVQVGGDIQNDSELDDDDDHANPERQRGKAGKEKSVNKKETGECLSMCCSSLSHPLNIKRKGHHAQPHQEHNFCQTSDNHNDYDKKDFGNEQRAIHADVILKSHNEYQQTAKKQHNHNSNSGRSKKSGMVVVKNSIMFPDLGITSAHTGVALGEQESENQRESMMNFCRYQEDVVACARTKPQSSSSTTTPVTNNYTNIKEALTRRISNKSCASSSKKQSHHHQNHHHCMTQERESVKGEVEGGLGEVVISSFKSSSSPSTRLPQPPTTTNSNKCMPISIKSPISWLPETCCNDSSGSGGSSNSRNTNTLLPDPRFYCPENYIDLDNNNEHELSHNRKTELERTVRPRRGGSDDCDFSIVFFEDRGTARKPKQKQSRVTAGATGSNSLRAVRSANATPVVSSKQFPFLDIPIPTQAAIVRQQQHQHFHPHPNHHDHHFQHHQQSQYNLDDDPIERASRGTRRNQIMGKTYLSDGGSLTSLDGLCEIRASTPVEIKKASRVIVNYPPPHHQIEDSKTVSRCLCKVDTNHPPLPVSSPGTRRKCPDGEVVNVHCDKVITGGANNIYEKLIDDSYGILICEGENTPHQRKNCNNGGGVSGSSSKKCIVSNKVTELSENELSTSCRVGGGVVAGVQKLRILCAKCLENHDPLLTNCLAMMNEDDGEDNHDDDDPDENSPYTNKNHYNPSSINVNLKHHHHVHFGEMNKSLPQLVSHYPNAPHNLHHHHPGSDTTDYPSDTEFTTNNVIEDDGQSLSTHFSSATCTWHHNHYQPTQLSQFIWAASSMMPTSSGAAGGSSSQCPKEFTSLEYVRTWLMASHPRTFAINNNFNSNNTHQHLHHNSHHENGISDNKRTLCQRAKTLTPSTTNNNNWRDEKGLVLSSSSKNKSSCDKAISKKKRFRKLEKRQRPVGRGASPPAKELGTSCATNSNNIEPSTTTGGDATEGAASRFQPPPSRKQHPLLFYDMIPRQPQQKPLTATPHKKCRDQLDLFHKELETVV